MEQAAEFYERELSTLTAKRYAILCMTSWT